MAVALRNYSRRFGIRSVRALVSLTTSYRKVIEATPWNKAGVGDVVILSPEAVPGAMVKAPRAQGEALVALVEGRLTSEWRSTDGLGLVIRRV